jgi:predicted N-acetyltransferase YhbS
VTEAWSLRAATTSDVEEVTRLIAACETAVDGVAEVHHTDVSQAIELAGEDAVVAVASGRIVGWASLIRDRATVNVDPTLDDTTLRAALQAWTEARARAHQLPRMKQIVSDADMAASQSLRDAGYEPIYSSWILEARVDEPPATGEVPGGITIRAYTSEDAHAAYRLIEDAFAEWPGRLPADFDTWSSYLIGHEAFAPSLSRLAFDGDELVGAAMSEAYSGEDEGWVQQLATKATHRRRRIAHALLRSVFAAFHASGRHRVGLSTNSLSGALSFYERVGMHVRRSYTAWALTWPDDRTEAG